MSSAYRMALGWAKAFGQVNPVDVQDVALAIELSRANRCLSYDLRGVR